MRTLNSWKTVFGNWKYTFLALTTALIFYFINVLIINFTTLQTSLTLLGFFKALYSFFLISISPLSYLLFYSFLTLIITSILVGTLLSFIIYKINLHKTPKTKTGLFASIGIFLGALAPGCAVCGIGLISALGLGGIIVNFLPYHGIELSILAIIILGYANWKISKELFICKTNLTKTLKYDKKLKNYNSKAERRNIK